MIAVEDLAGEADTKATGGGKLAGQILTGMEIAANARNGVINKVSGVKLLQGDLAEAWREDNEEYATVAMRFSLTDVMQDRATGRVVSGDPAKTDEATEVWTFVRPVGSGQQGWKLSAIQQTA